LGGRRGESGEREGREKRGAKHLNSG
jgi:hypothetical protein